MPFKLFFFCIATWILWSFYNLHLPSLMPIKFNHQASSCHRAISSLPFSSMFIIKCMIYKIQYLLWIDWKILFAGGLLPAGPPEYDRTSCCWPVSICDFVILSCIFIANNSLFFYIFAFPFLIKSISVFWIHKHLHIFMHKYFFD